MPMLSSFEKKRKTKKKERKENWSSAHAHDYLVSPRSRPLQTVSLWSSCFPYFIFFSSLAMQTTKEKKRKSIEVVWLYLQMFEAL